MVVQAIQEKWKSGNFGPVENLENEPGQLVNQATSQSGQIGPKGGPNKRARPKRVPKGGPNKGARPKLGPKGGPNKWARAQIGPEG